MSFLFFTLILNLGASSASASFLSYTETTKIESQLNLKGSDPKVAKMIKGSQGAFQAKPTVTQHFIHNGVKASYEGGRLTSITDMKNLKMYIFEPKDKTYMEMSLKDMIGQMSNIAQKMDVKMKTQYKRVEGQKKIAGRACRMYQELASTQMGAIGMNSEDVTYKCLWLQSPAAWKEFQLLGLKAATPHIYKVASIQKGKPNPDLGFPLYTRSSRKSSMRGAGQVNPMMPATVALTTVSNISTKPFSPSRVRIPKGYRKKSMSKPPGQYPFFMNTEKRKKKK